MRKYLFVAVFVSGMTSLAIEMAASRLLENVFGTSNLVWAAIIGLILIYLAVGYFVGGSWADRSPHLETFYKILMWAAMTTAIVPVISRPVLSLAADAFDVLQLGTLFGSFIAVLILLSIPITLLGTASPFAIRLAAEETGGLGKTSGRIYAISTLGSFVGTFLPPMLLIPTIGTYRTFLTIAAALLVIALPGLFVSAGWRKALPYFAMPIIVLVLLWRGLPENEKNTQGMIYETESAYNYIQVLQEDDYRYLRLNEGQGVHSVYNPSILYYAGPWEQVLAAPFFNSGPVAPSQVQSMAIVGLAAGTTARQASAVYPNIQIDGFEIDPKIVEAGRKYFDMTMPNLNVIVQDGRWGLEHSNRKYQVISVDAYRPPYIPYHLTTTEFFEIVHSKLTDDGVLVINIGRSTTDRRLINCLASTIKQVFPTIYVIDIPNTFNSILYATIQPTEMANLIQNYDYLVTSGTANPLLITALQVAIVGMQNAPEPGLVFTDDRAPVEWITNDIILSYLFSNEMGKLQ